MYHEKRTAYQHVCHFMYMNQKETFVATRCWCSQTLVFLFVLLIFWPWSCQGAPSTQGLLNFTRDPFGPGNRWHASTLSTRSLHAAYIFNLATFTNAGDSDQLWEYMRIRFWLVWDVPGTGFLCIGRINIPTASLFSKTLRGLLTEKSNLEWRTKQIEVRRSL